MNHGTYVPTAYLQLVERKALIAAQANMADPRVQMGFTTWFITGFVLVFAMNFLRGKFRWFRILPSGLLLATLGGDTIWAAFIVAAVIKTLVLRIGGIELYNQKARPFFEGLFISFAIVTFLKASLGSIYLIQNLNAPAWY